MKKSTQDYLVSLPDIDESDANSVQDIFTETTTSELRSLLSEEFFTLKTK